MVNYIQYSVEYDPSPKKITYSTCSFYCFLHSRALGNIYSDPSVDKDDRQKIYMIDSLFALFKSNPIISTILWGKYMKLKLECPSSIKN